MRNHEQGVIEFFSQYKIKAKKIPESSDKTPDFLIEYGGKIILIELKTKVDSRELIQKREEAFKNGEIYEHTDVIGRKNSISKRVRQACDQLKVQKGNYEADFCFVVLLADGVYSSQQFSQFETSLYGDKEIIPMGSEIDRGIKKCYYFTNSDFHNHRDVLDGALILGANTGKFCINSLAESYDEVIKSEFINLFRPGVLDPNEQEKLGNCYLLDDETPRDNEEFLKLMLCKKYNIEKIVTAHYPNYIVSARVPILD